jgi:hypothetical protein
MPAEHLRYKEDGTVGLYQGYFCMHCGAGGVSMVASGHGPGKCEPNQELVQELEKLNSAA